MDSKKDRRTDEFCGCRQLVEVWYKSIDKDERYVLQTGHRGDDATFNVCWQVASLVYTCLRLPKLTYA